ncbi:hypothetical protein TNIN_196701 [Trichonephila inaurata madagascariensis]|uniref:Uncharacterized protein n=1 Tax=Trichonephila inaurata madagascariensis TaxID=2747483 RepID=A0A8X6XYE8_9ARAC|nr:hypothetical protein TNIN_196701 [Trichonephila inaurata madagascariensis]
MKQVCNCYGMQLVLCRDESEEFVAHGASVTCLALGRKSGRVMVTGGEDKKVNLWAVGKSNCIMVSKCLQTSNITFHSESSFEFD